MVKSTRKNKNWSEEEDNLLRENRYMTHKEIHEKVLPHRPLSGIKSRITRLGLGTKRKITELDLQYMRDNVETQTIEEIAEHLDIHRSTVSQRLKKMGLLTPYNERTWEATDVDIAIDGDNFIVDFTFEFKGEDDE